MFSAGKAIKFSGMGVVIKDFERKNLPLYQTLRMHLLFVAATFFEVRPLFDKLRLIGKSSALLSTYKFRDIPVDLLIPGVGMVPTAYHLGRQLSIQSYDLVINAGIAGTYNASLPLGAVVNVTEECIPEFGAEDGTKFLSVFELGLADPDEWPYRNGKLINYSNFEPLGSYLETLIAVKGITTNTVKGSAESIARMRSQSNADIESMEGAAFFYAAAMAGNPFYQIRSISNLVEERDKSRWNLKLSLKNLNNSLEEILSSICR